MAQEKPKRISGRTPEGTFQYPYLVKPDFGNAQFPDPDGTFKVNLILSLEDAQPLIEQLQPVYDKAMADGAEGFAKLKVEQRKKLKSLTEIPLYTPEYDKETEEETGNVIFKFSTSASGKNAKGEAWKRTLPLFDAGGNKCKPSMVASGTKGKVAYEVSPYFIPGSGSAGIKLYLTAAQIISLVESGGGGSAESYGFGKEEGYSAADNESTSDFEGTDSEPTDADQF